MMLYYCPTCGYWQDVHFLWWLSTRVDNLAHPDGYACPFGHGMLAQVKDGDRIMLRQAAPVETGSPTPVLPGEESEETHG